MASKQVDRRESDEIVIQGLTKEQIQKVREKLTTMKIPANMMIDKKVTTTISVPEELNKRIDELSRELDMTKSLLLLLGFLFFLYVVTRD
jgi:RNase adaptor protein for sRNA GlmZ degradation